MSGVLSHRAATSTICIPMRSSSTAQQTNSGVNAQVSGRRRARNETDLLQKMKLRIRDTSVEETVVTITRSSPRRRKRESDKGVDGLETPSPASKRIKKQPEDAAKKISKAVKQEVNLDGTQTIMDRDSPKPLEKHRRKAGTSKAAGVRAHEAEPEQDEEMLHGDSAGTPKRKPEGKEHAKKARNVKEQQLHTEEEDKALDAETPRKRNRKAKDAKKVKEIKEQDTDIEDETKDIDGATPTKPKRKRKTKEEKEAEAMPLAARTTGLCMFVGAHVSIAKGLQNSVANCHHIGGNAFALFLKSQRKWDNPALTDESRDAFHSHCDTHKYDPASHVLPHGSYLVNLAQEDKDKANQAYDAFIDDLHRCERLGIKLYNFHPGAHGSSPLPEAIKRIANQLNTALAATRTVIPVLENMAGSGTVIGSRFSDLRDIISHIKPEFKSRIGVCIDTCHAFAAGYDLRSPDSFKRVLQDFDDTVGIKYLKALHLNDSKAPLGSKRDLHQNIGLGFLGLRAFHNVMNEPRFENLPLILETPCDKPDPRDLDGKKTVEDKGVWAREIKLLEGLIGMDVEGEEFKGLARELGEKGREEREKTQKGIDAREEKVRKKLERGQRSLVDMMSGKKKGKGEKKGKVARKGEESTGASSESDSD